MQAITLLIKGTVEEAKAALVAHGVNPADWLTTPTLGDRPDPETTLRVRAENEPGLARWFAEPPCEAPYPPGSLLYYAGWSETLGFVTPNEG
jgi:hypothetical protein